jgi:hypothetical protein
LEISIVEVLKKFGFNSIAAFKGHFSRNIDPDAFIESLEKFIQNLPDDSPLVDLLEISQEEIKEFNFFPGHAGAIIGFMEKMKEIVSNPDHQTPHVPPQVPSRIEVTAANAASYLRSKLLARLKDIVSDDQHLLITKSRTTSFPYSFKIQCFNCTQLETVTISLEPRGSLLYNIRASKFTKHVKECMSQNQQNHNN